MRENDWVGIYRDDGIVLRTQKLGEADRIVTLLAKQVGPGQGGGQGGAPDQVEVRRPAGAVHAMWICCSTPGGRWT